MTTKTLKDELLKIQVLIEDRQKLVKLLTSLWDEYENPVKEVNLWGIVEHVNESLEDHCSSLKLALLYEIKLIDREIRNIIDKEIMPVKYPKNMIQEIVDHHNNINHYWYWDLSSLSKRMISLISQSR